jgi:RHS repeat-associated protein
VLQTYSGVDGVPVNGSPYGTLRTSYWPSASPTLVNRGLVYDGVGNITSIADGVNTETIGYTYDELNRLTTASAPAGESFGYNEIGNLIWKGSSSNPLSYPPSGPGSVHPHAVTGFAGTGYIYDANGSLITRGSQSITYDARRLPVRVDSSGATLWRTAYDGDGIRRKRLDASGTMHYLGGGYEHNLGDGRTTTDTVTKYYAGLGRTLAMRTNGTLYWMGTDHLGGTLRVTDASFAHLDQLRYTPYGVSRDPGTALGTDHLFTGQIQTQSIELYWYASRAYDPTLGRFCCPDSIVPSASDPQALNRYTYVRNNRERDKLLHWCSGCFIGAVAQVSAQLTEPGEITQVAGPGKLFIGERAGGASLRTAQIAQAFEHAGMPSAAYPQIRNAIWEKFLLICGLSGIRPPTTNGTEMSVRTPDVAVPSLS